MTWSIGVPLEKLQELANRTIMRNWIWHRDYCLEPKDALVITVHHRSTVWLLSISMLHVVMAAAVSFPNIDLYPTDWFAIGILDVAEYEAGFALRVMRYQCSVWLCVRVVGVEWPQNRALCTCRWFWVVYTVDEEREANDI